jgi:hypothetical protein
LKTNNSSPIILMTWHRSKKLYSPKQWKPCTLPLPLTPSSTVPPQVPPLSLPLSVLLISKP